MGWMIVIQTFFFSAKSTFMGVVRGPGVNHITVLTSVLREAADLSSIPATGQNFLGRTQSVHEMRIPSGFLARWSSAR